MEKSSKEARAAFYTFYTSKEHPGAQALRAFLEEKPRELWEQLLSTQGRPEGADHAKVQQIVGRGLFISQDFQSFLQSCQAASKSSE
jgi:hypothetical protein